jgi:hypothetical protein
VVGLACKPSGEEVSLEVRTFESEDIWRLLESSKIGIVILSFLCL